MSRMYAVRLSNIIGLCILVTLTAASCHGNPNNAFHCDLHDVKDEMPGLAAFRGEDQANNIDELIARYRDAVADRSVEESEGYFCIANLLLAADRKDEALSNYSKSIVKNDVRYEHFLSRGRLRRELGDCAGALSDFKFALQNGGRGFGLDLARAEALIDCDSSEKALKILDSSSAQVLGKTMPISWGFARARALAVFVNKDVRFFMLRQPSYLMTWQQPFPG